MKRLEDFQYVVQSGKKIIFLRNSVLPDDIS